MTAELELGEERVVAPGVWVERRGVLASVAGLLLGIPGSALAQAPGADMAYDQFLAEVTPLAKALLADTSIVGQDRYLLTLASVAVRLSDVEQPAMRDSGQGAGPGTFIGANPGGEVFTVLHWRMEPGSEVRRHAHTYGNVVTLGLAGAARVQNYEVVGARDYATAGPFIARKTKDQWLTRHGVNLVNLERDYIHGSRAGPEGARGLDITTRLRPKAPTPYLMLEHPDAPEPQQASWRFD
jgi:hypothetical protein